MINQKSPCRPPASSQITRQNLINSNCSKPILALVRDYHSPCSTSILDRTYEKIRQDGIATARIMPPGYKYGDDHRYYTGFMWPQHSVVSRRKPLPPRDPYVVEKVCVCVGQYVKNKNSEPVKIIQERGRTSIKFGVLCSDTCWWVSTSFRKRPIKFTPHVFKDAFIKEGLCVTHIDFKKKGG